MTLLHRYRVFTSGILGRSLALARSAQDPTSPAMTSSDRRSSVISWITRRKNADSSHSQPEREFIKMTARISVYPLVLILTNGVTTGKLCILFSYAER